METDCVLPQNEYMIAGEGPREDGVHTWSVRTRAVAQYLQKAFQSESSKRPLRNLSLNRILEGRTRNECAKLFFETLLVVFLVLKSNAFIEVQQEHPYGDIDLSMAPRLAKGKF
ncbi:hypothetical protein AMTR_s00052p00146950 [Amborella trichopoda]|uniref:Rad21/Rec8-like protein C-terminal eukaryotic domain-containing protein n=1 Tax=Amborella trichopoda TaxID=13333 RepID=U5D2C8_AMBTC|nr:hypothetical protein AMTR_s00052p00146950 [Amborella trichopoda]